MQALLPSLVDRINAAHVACVRHGSDSIEGSIEVGRLLWEAKREVKREPSARWIPWVEQHCKFGRWQAANYMRAYQGRDQIREMGSGAHHFLGLRGALKAIARSEAQAETVQPEDHKASNIVGSLSDLIERGDVFATIYADPPWRYGNQGTRAATDDHYKTMTVEEICAEPVEQITEDNAHLHLWTTNAFLPEAFAVMEAWGFAYKSCFVWVKPQMGIGNYWRVSHEFLLFGIRGKAPFRARDEMSWAAIDRGQHSAKPDEIRQKIEKVSPGPYLEMYGRESRGLSPWTVYGNQVTRRLL